MSSEHINEAAPSSRRERRTSDVRDRIVGAAIDLFGELGYAGTSMERIAAEAGVARASVFNHFAQKELLVDAVLEVHLDNFYRRLHADPEPDCSLREQITDAVAEWSMAYATDVDTAVPTLRSWVLAGGPYLPISDEGTTMYENLIRTAQETGRLPDSGSPVAIARALNDAIMGAMIRWTREEEPTAVSLRDPMLAAIRAINFE